MMLLLGIGLGGAVGLLLGSFLVWSVAGTWGHPDPRGPAAVDEQPGRDLAALRLRVQVADALAAQERLRSAHTGAGTAALLGGLLAAEEGTRGQLAAELHDTVAQSLLLARSRLADLATGALASELEPIAELVAEAEEQLRGVIARTRPALHEADLGSAVGMLCDDFANRYGLQVAVRWPAEPVPLPMTVAVPTYRFFAEALLNVVKHAEGDRAEAALDVRQGWLFAEVSDSGQGFVPELVCPRAGRQVGLDLLAARLRLGGGTLDVRSAPGRGTTVRLRLPIDPGAPVPEWPDDSSAFARQNPATAGRN